MAVVPEVGADGNSCMASSEWIPLSRMEVALSVGDASWPALAHREARPLYNFPKEDLVESRYNTTLSQTMRTSFYKRQPVISTFIAAADHFSHTCAVLFLQLCDVIPQIWFGAHIQLVRTSFFIDQLETYS